MTNDKGILIKNIYYMLCYAFVDLKKESEQFVDKEDFKNIQDLFAEVLYRGMSKQLKQGLFREYLEKHDTLATLRGKIDINETIKHRIKHHNVLACEFDELTENNILNQTLKTTAYILMRTSDVDIKKRGKLKSLMPFFDGVELIRRPSQIQWNRLRFQRSNQTYRILMNICRFIIENMIQTTENGSYRMTAFTDEHMERLFEKFILEYYKRTYPELKANPDSIDWAVDNGTNKDTMLPTMNTDITLHGKGRTLIIDAKYYGKSLQENYDKKSIRSGHLYQIFSYVKNKDKWQTGNVSGLLLYAKTQDDDIPDLDVTISNNRIMAKSLDLNQDFDNIKAQLKGIASMLE